MVEMPTEVNTENEEKLNMIENFAEISSVVEINKSFNESSKKKVDDNFAAETREPFAKKEDTARKLPYFDILERIDYKERKSMEGHDVWTLAVFTSVKGKTYIATDGNQADHAVTIWDVEMKEIAGTFKGHTDTVCGFVEIKCDNRGQCLVSGSDDNTIRLWDVKKSVNVFSINVGYKVRALCSFGACVAVGFRDSNIIQLWNVTTKEKMGSLKGHSGGVFCLAVFTNENGKSRLASGSDDGIIKIWDLVTMSLICTLDNDLSTRVTALATYTDLQGTLWLISGNNNGRVELWDLKNETLKVILAEDRGYYISSFALFLQYNRGVCLAYGDRNGTIKIWDLESRICLNPLESADTSWVENVTVFSDKDGRATLVSCNGSTTVHIWEELVDRTLSYKMR